MRRVQRAVRHRVAEEIRKARVAAGLSRKDLAARLGRRQAWVVASENATRRILVSDLAEIGEALKIDPVVLWRRALRPRRRRSAT